MQIRTPPGSLSCRVNLYANLSAYQSYQRPLGIDFPAAHTCSLGDMLGAMGRLFRHVGFSDRLRFPIPTVAAFMLLAHNCGILVRIILNGDRFLFLLIFLLLVTSFS